MKILIHFVEKALQILNSKRICRKDVSQSIPQVTAVKIALVCCENAWITGLPVEPLYCEVTGNHPYLRLVKYKGFLSHVYYNIY